MSPLDLVPAPYRILAVLLLIFATFGAGFVEGLKHDEGKVEKLVNKQLTEGIRIAKARDIVTTVTETKYLPQQAHENVVTETIIKEVPVYVPADSPALPGGFRVLHDAAALGIVPEPSSVGNAAPVPAQDATNTVAENYGACRQDQLKLEELQDWIREQQKVK